MGSQFGIKRTKCLTANNLMNGNLILQDMRLFRAVFTRDVNQVQKLLKSFDGKNLLKKTDRVSTRSLSQKCQKRQTLNCYTESLFVIKLIFPDLARYFLSSSMFHCS